MNNLIVKEYLGNNIEFKKINGEVYANATSMCRAFGKQPSDWTRLTSTQEYINEIEGSENLPRGVKLVDVINDGFNNGTWIHEKLILDLARWLNIKFRVWCDTQIAALIREGEVKLIPKTYAEALLEAGRLALMNEELENKNAQQKQLIAEYEPKVTYYDTILKSKGLLNITQIAKDYGLSGASLNSILHEQKVQFKQGKQWLLYSKYAKMGYTKSKTWENNGQSGLRTQWTQKGRLFIHGLLNSLGIDALMDKED